MRRLKNLPVVLFLAIITLVFQSCAESTGRSTTPDPHPAFVAFQGCPEKPATTVSDAIPPVPSGAVRACAIERGSTGDRVNVYDFFPADNTYLMRHTVLLNTSTDRWTTDLVTTSVNNADAAIKDAVRTWGVPGNNIRAFISNGFRNNAGTMADYYKSSMEAKGYVVESVSARNEALYGAMAFIPLAFLNQTGFIEIGGSSVQFFSGGQIHSMNIGAKTDSAVYTDDQIRAMIREGFRSVPGLPYRNRMIVASGGLYLALCFVEPDMVCAEKADMPYLSFTQEDLTGSGYVPALAERVDYNYSNFLNKGLLDYYSPGQIKQAIRIMQLIMEEITKVNPNGTPTYSYANQLISWSVARTAALVTD